MLEILQFDFMQRAFVAGLLMAIIAPTIGMFLVMRRYSFMADTLAHVSLAGVALAVLLGLHPILTALVLSVGAAISSEVLRRNGRVVGEGVLVLFLSGGLALSAVLLSLTGGGIGVQSILFGSILTVTAEDIGIITVLGVAVIVVVGGLFKELFISTFDEELALVSGVPARSMNMILLILAAITVAVSMRIVGVLLVGALMVVPVLAAMQWQKSFKATWLIAIFVALLSVLIGLIVSYGFGLASGGTIVLMAIGLFLISWIIQRIRH
jgi:zinc transport system permease protein